MPIIIGTTSKTVVFLQMYIKQADVMKRTYIHMHTYITYTFYFAHLQP